MADDDKLSNVDLTYGRPAPEDGVSWSDYLKGMQSGAASQIVGGVAAIAEDVAGDSRFGALAGDVRAAANQYAADKMKETSPKFQRRVAANFFYGDGPSVWEEGIVGSLLAKAAVSAPSIIATAVPGGMVGRAFMSARAGLVAAQAAGGALTTGSVLNEIYNEFDKLPDDKLMANSPAYAGYRNMGMSEQDARARIREDVAGVEPYLVGAISALIPGAEGALASRLGGHAAKGSYLGTIAKRGAGEGAQEFVEESTGELAQQRALQPFTLNDLDWMKALEAGAQGAAVGAPLGGVTGAVERIGGGEKAPRKPGQATQQVTLPEPDTSLDTGAVDPAQQVALNDKLSQGAPAAAAAAAPAPAGSPAQAAGVAQPPPASPVDPNAVSTRRQATPEQIERAKPKAASKQGAAPAVTQQVTETPEQEAARLVTELSPGVDPAAATALEAKAAPTPAPPEQEAAQLVKDLTQPAPAAPAASEPAAANPVPAAPLVSSVQEGPVATGSPVASPEVRTPPQEQVPTVVEPPSAKSPYDRAIALIESGTPLTSVNSVQLKVGTGYNTAVKLYARLKKEGRISQAVPKPQKAVSRPVEAPPAATEGVAATPVAATESARPEASVAEAPAPVTQQVTEAPKAAELKRQVKEKVEASPVRKVEVSEEEKARLVAASEAKVPTRRILAPGTPEARAKAEAAQAEMAAVQARVNDELKAAKKKEAAGDAPTGSKDTKRNAKTEADATAANNIIQQGTPSQITTVTTPAHKQAVAARLAAIVEEAERQDIQIRKINRDSVPAPLVYLADARMMANKITNGKATYEEINQFLRDEADVRAGGGDMMRQRRKEVNAALNKRAVVDESKVESSGRIEEAKEVKPDADEVREDDRGGGGSALVDTSTETDADENTNADDAYDEDGNYAGQIRERPQVKVAEDAVRGYSGVKEGTVKTEKVVGGRRKLGITVTAPKGAALLNKVKQMSTQQVTAEETAPITRRVWETTDVTTARNPEIAQFVKEKNELKTWLNNLSDADYAMLMKHLGTGTMWNPQYAPVDTMEPARVLAEFKRAVAMGDKYTFDGMAHDPKQAKPLAGPRMNRETGLDDNAEDWYTDTASLLGFVKERFAKHNTQVETTIHNMISKRVTDLVGDVETVVVNKSRMKEIASDAGLDVDKGIPTGLYFQRDDKIVILQDALADPGSQFVMLHEAIHAATSHVIDSDENLRSEIRSLMEFVKQHTNRDHYGLTDEHEFIAEAMSAPDFQLTLHSIRLTPEMSASFGLGGAIRTAWDWFVMSVRRALGLPKGVHSAFDAAMQISDRILRHAEGTNRLAADPADTMDIKALPSYIGDKMRQATQWVNNTPVTEDELISDAGPRLMAVRTFDNISRAADQYFGGADNNPVRKAQETVEKMRVHGQDVFEKAAPLIEALYTLEKKYNGAKWDAFAELSHDATMLNVHPDKPLDDPANAHLSKRKDAQAIAEWKNLNARWNALPDELKAAWSKTTAYYRDMQNAMAFSILKNRVLKTLAGDMSEGELDALARRYFNNQSTEADAAKLGKDLDNALKSIDELKSIKGPYFPQMRRGDWAVIGRVQFDNKPANGTKVDDTTFTFKDEKSALDYANKLWRENGIKATVKGQYVDPKTGLTYFTDTDGTKVKATSEEPAAERRFLVSVQDEFLEYHATMAEAEERAKEIGKTMKKVAVEERRVQPQARGELYSEQLRSVMKRIEQQDAYKNLSKEARAETVRALNELSYQLFGATRIQSRRLPRRYVAGASRDVTRNAMEYAQSVAGYIGKLRYQPELDAAVKQMHDYNEANRYTDRQKSVARSRIANEVDRRLSAPPQAFISKLDQNVQRLLTASFLDKLASLSYSVINSTQTVTNTMPMLAARHGWAKSTKAMTQAYSMIGGARNLGVGVANTGRALRGTQQVNVLSPVRERLAKHGPEYVALFDYLRERGVVSSDAGMEVVKAARMGKGVGGAIDKGLSYGDSIARALPEAVEVNNRVASAVASYMLSRAKGLSAEQARRYAYDTVNGTQFNYSQTNAPAFMNNPMARIVFQFKKYAQGQYQLLGEQVGKVLHGASREERMEGIKALVNFTATTMVFAGALGLPTEPIKYALMAASVFGLGYSYDDLERDVRAAAAGAFGTTGGAMLTRGVTRGLPFGFAFDLSSRMGLSDLTSFGQPRENTLDAWNSWLWRTVSGAPAGLVSDLVRGANKIATGDIDEGVELMIPFKTVADGITTYRLATEGKRSGVTGRQTLDPLTGPEAFIRSLGFKPAREADTLERDNAYYTVKKERMGQRQQLVSKWLNAKDGDERSGVWKQIVKYNAGVDEVARISMGQLTTAQKRRNSEERRGTIVDGKRVTKDDRGIYDTGNIYDVRVR